TPAFGPNKLLEAPPCSAVLPKERFRWNADEVRAGPLFKCPLARPLNGSVILYNRKKVKYRKDGYCWKKRKDGKTTREDHMKLKVQGVENPDMVLVHYLNVLSLEGCGAMSGPLLCVSGDRRDSQCWTREELHSQLKPMFYSTKWSCSDSSGAPDFSVDHLVQNVLETRQAKPQPRTCSCLCSTTLGEEGGGGLRCTQTVGWMVSCDRPYSPHPTPFNLNFSGTDIAHPSMAHPASLVSAAAPSLAVAAPCSCAKSLLSSTPGVAVLSLNLPLRPISGGTFTSDRLVSGCNSPGSLPLPASSPCCPLAFDPDSFLNSSKRGQAYGGTSQSSCVSASLAPDIPSLALPLCPSSLPSSPSRSPLAEVGCGRSSATGLPRRRVFSLHATREHSAVKHFFGTRFLCFRGSVSVCVSVCAMSHSLFGPFCHVTVTSCDRFWLFLKLGALLPQGGVTVLITGPWTETSGCYSCVFDQSTVPASLIQPGVLRCYCPTHEVGLVALQVLEGMAAVSSSVLFEYRARSMASLPSLQLDWPSLDDNQFRMSILERLEQMEKRMAEMTSPTGGTGQQPQGTQRGPVPEAPVADERSWFEQRIVALFERMMAGGRWGGGSEKLIHSVRHRGMTLLHLAAAQGYTKLIHTLIHWRSVNSDSLDLEEEVDPLNVDHFSCTPLMWACALGHQGAAVLLYRWNSLALGIPDSLGRLPLTVARSRGHSHLARRLEEITCRQHPFLQLPLSPISTSPDTGESCELGSFWLVCITLNIFSHYFKYSEALSENFEAELLSYTQRLFHCPLQVDMVALAEQIIEATPERIKQEEERRGNSAIQDTMPWLASYLDNVDSQPSLSLPSTLALRWLRPPSSAAWAEFLSASASGCVERDFALLTLSDSEQRELYEAARVIQNTFRRYKGRRLKEQQDRAAAVIQRCYRKYKQLTWTSLKYALYKKMTQAAILIQSKFRSYYEQKKFQQSRRAAVLIQQYYRSYKEYERLKQGSFLTKKQDQAARKIMRFFRRCRHR
uniref:Calmodulin binding transcription activator 2 n=1 Tax=Scleropages formosus TaxID=113540 RepID=A0A8D0CC85_SCLFO